MTALDPSDWSRDLLESDRRYSRRALKSSPSPARSFPCSEARSRSPPAASCSASMRTRRRGTRCLARRGRRPPARARKPARPALPRRASRPPRGRPGAPRLSAAREHGFIPAAGDVGETEIELVRPRMRTIGRRAATSCVARSKGSTVIRSTPTSGSRSNGGNARRDTCGPSSSAARAGSSEPCAPPRAGTCCGSRTSSSTPTAGVADSRPRRRSSSRGLPGTRASRPRAALRSPGDPVCTSIRERVTTIRGPDGVGAEPGMTGPLSPEAIEAYRRDGRVVVQGMFDLEEVRSWTDECERLWAGCTCRPQQHAFAVARARRRGEIADRLDPILDISPASRASPATRGSSPRSAACSTERRVPSRPRSS